MREIKFRLWDEAGEMHRDFGEMSYYENELPGNDATAVMQYTGLKDKNGVEIYEGDIYSDMHNADQRCVISWHEDDARFCYSYPMRPRFSGEKITYFTIKKLDGFCKGEVIGNIYQNPELLEGDK